MRIYIIAGEASGDLHASNMVREMKKLDTSLEFRGWGGDLMTAQGVEVVKHYRELAFMGFVEVILNLRAIRANFRFCRKDILDYKPDAVILIDYPGFNLRMAEFLHNKGVRVLYYISPQVWAWKQSRVRKIKRFVEKMFVILPFEKEFYYRFAMEVEFVGHPLLDVVGDLKNPIKDENFIGKYGLDGRPMVALLPGSRKQEIATMLPLMLSVVNDFPEYQFVIAAAPSQEMDYYQSFAGGKIKIVEGDTYGLLRHARAALVTSGTATLETALFNVPEVVCYKAGYVSYLIARMLVKIKYISLVNLIVDREIVKELIQSDLTRQNIRAELRVIVDESPRREAMLADYSELRSKLGGGGASENVAKSVLKTLQVPH